MEEILDKYNIEMISKLDKGNINKIIDFLVQNNCDFIEDIISDYLDLFSIDYDEFVNKYNILNKKYNNEFLIKASEDMNLLEEFFYD